MVHYTYIFLWIQHKNELKINDVSVGYSGLPNNEFVNEFSTKN